jgi:tetratricopeptide (TPR) repeat protein
MRGLRVVTFLALSAALAGCGKSSPRVGKPHSGFFGDEAGLRLDAPDDKSRRSALRLDEIEPRPELPAPATRAATAEPSPPDALVLYAQGRRSLMDGQRFSAIKQLEGAIALDPLAPAPYLLLAQALLGDGTFNDKSIRALETAAELDPADTATRVELGRQYLAKGDAPRAVAHLRLAMATPGYQDHEDEAALVDLFLARALDKGGYGQAAVDQYERLLGRVRTGQLSLRKDPEMSMLVASPELISLEIGRLHEAAGRYELALAALDPVAAEEPGNFDVQARVVRLMKQVGRRDEAVGRAVDLLTRFRANAASVALLREVGRSEAHGSGDAVQHLRRLSKANPTDRALLFALSDTLRAEGQESEATRILVEALGAQSANVEVAKRLFGVYDAQGNVTAAAKLLIDTVAAQPESLRELAPLWSQLTELARPGRLRLADVEQIDVASGARAAKLLFVATSAEALGRRAVAQAALEQAVRESPRFAPAYRLLLERIWSDAAAFAPAERSSASQQLIARARRSGDEALALELTGLTYLHEADPASASAALRDAVRVNGDSPDRILAAARAAEAAGEARRAESLLWKLVSDRPTCDAAYEALFAQYLQRGDTVSAVRVVSRWLAADPGSVNARLLQASVFRQSSHTDPAERVLDALVAEHPANAAVLGSLYVARVGSGQIDAFVAKLESLWAGNRANHAAGEMLVRTYAELNRHPDAARVLDALKEASQQRQPADADALYHFASLYTHIRQTEAAEALLEAAVSHDPTHAGASNDLGYSWADHGRNLERAETLVRVAVGAEPTNASFLDSLGWVLYKRGQFAEAQQHLQQAAGATEKADPIVLDHLGDTLYQQKQLAEAVATWQRSLQRIAEEDAGREDLQELKLKLLQKLKQAEAGQVVNVAPTGDHSATRVGTR